jgi:hypothetical protein
VKGALSFETSDAAPSFETPGGYVGQARRLRRASRGRRVAGWHRFKIRVGG